MRCHSRVGVLSHFSRVQVFATPWTVARQAPLSMGILQVRTLEWVAAPSSRGSSRPRNQTCVSCISCTGRQILYHCTTWETQRDLRWAWDFAAGTSQRCWMSGRKGPKKCWEPVNMSLLPSEFCQGTKTSAVVNSISTTFVERSRNKVDIRRINRHFQLNQSGFY